MELRVITLKPPDNMHSDEIMKNIWANKGTILYFIALLLVIIFACGQAIIALPLAQPAVSVGIMTDYCPSIEVQAGMRIAWINLDDVDRTVIVERTTEQGNVVGSGGVRLLQTGDSFSIILDDPGKYTYYCSMNRLASGTITILK